MIILITYADEERDGKICVSHGVDYHTLKNIVLPNDPIEFFGARYDIDGGFYYVK